MLKTIIVATSVQVSKILKGCKIVAEAAQLKVAQRLFRSPMERIITFL